MITKHAISWIERGLLPDALVRFGIRRLSAKRLREERSRLERDPGYRRFVSELAESPVALVPEAANEQHYEVPPAFFEAVLGKHLKYSSAYFAEGVNDLDRAEEEALRLTCEHADLRDGQEILELGCGWGSLTLFMARRYPGARITAVSNSTPQLLHILAKAKERGLSNVEVLTADVNAFQPGRTFDRVVSVEMFEHMRNYRELLARIASWLEPQGRLFVHIFTHDRFAYPFEDRGPDDWMARHFFTGGIMPSADLLQAFDDDLVVEERWRWSGEHYQKTAEAWLRNLDRQRDRVAAIFAETYGRENVTRWIQRWRVFFLACAELFGYQGGSEWGVHHYRFRRSQGSD